jgi:hypothetical protein
MLTFEVGRDTRYLVIAKPRPRLVPEIRKEDIVDCMAEG